MLEEMPVITPSLLAGSVSPTVHAWPYERDLASPAPDAAEHEAMRQKIKALALTVLVVDDDPNFARAIRRRLENDYGVKVKAVASGDAALQDDLAQYDVLLVDVVMPGMSGVVTCEEMLGRGVTAVIALMSTDSGNEETAKAHGVAFYDKNTPATELEPILLCAAGGRSA